MEISEKTASELDDAKEIENLKKVEAALFIAGKWLSLAELVTLTDLNPLILKQLLKKIVERYEDSAIEILSKNEMWKMDVKPEYVDMVNKLATGSAEFTRAEQATLAIIAHKQPVKQSYIVKVRGNKAYEHIKNFLALNLIKARKLGHTKELTLSEEFHDYFHVGKEGLNKREDEEEKARDEKNKEESTVEVKKVEEGNEENKQEENSKSE